MKSDQLEPTTWAPILFRIASALRIDPAIEAKRARTQAPTPVALALPGPISAQKFVL